MVAEAALSSAMRVEIDMSTGQEPRTAPPCTWQYAPTKTVNVSGTTFAYRELGPENGVPVIFLNHLAAELDRWDPRVVDGIAAKRRVIVFDNRGVGASEGSVPNSVEAMAHDAIAFIRALGFEQVDLLGFSLGGFVSQAMALEAPHLFRRIILAGTGPAGGVGIDKVTRVTIRDMIKAALTFRHPEFYLFFTSTANGRRAGRDFLRRLNERAANRDKGVSIRAFITQLKAIHAWGRQTPADLSRIKQPVLVANGDQDKMVPTSNSIGLARRIPNSELVLYDDAGHGGIFQYHQQFVPKALAFLGS